MLPRESYQAWLDPDATEAELLGPLIPPLPGELMEGYPTGAAVNRPANDGPLRVEPA